MIIRRLLSTALALSLIACGEKPAERPPATRIRPNIVLISIDTLRADALGIYGNPTVKTPVIDGLGKNGALFLRHLSHVPLTLPSHASMLTGKLPTGHGIHDNNGYQLPPSVPTLAEAFAKEGYATAAFVSSSVLDHRFGLNRGFHVYEDRFEFVAGKYERRSEDIGAITTDRILQWLRTNARSPYFLLAHYYDPHAPYHPPSGYEERNGSGYLGEVSYVDEQVGRLLQALQPARSNTVVVVTSDHGEGLGEHSELGHGLFLYDSTLRVPLIINGLSITAKSIHVQTGIVDLAPTLMELAEIPVPQGLDGRSLLPVIRGEKEIEHPVFSETMYPMQIGWSPLFAYSASGLKHVEAPQPELYDIRNDPGETKNLYSGQQAANQSMIQRIQSYRKAALAAPRGKNTDSDLEEQLRSLGYLSGSTTVADPDALPDPKGRIDVWKLFEESTYLSMDGKNEEALALVRKAVKLEPSNAVLYDTMGRYLFGKDPEQAAIQWQKALELDPRNAAYHHKLAGCYERSGRLDSALQEEQLALAIHPGMMEALLGLSETLLRLNRPAEALKTLDQLLQRDARNASALYQSGVASRMLGNPVQAIDFFERAIAVSPDLPLAYYEAGILKGQSGDLAGADQMMQGALRADPEFAEAHYDLGVLYERMGRPPDAVREYKQFVEHADRARLADRVAAAQKRIAELQ